MEIKVVSSSTLLLKGKEVNFLVDPQANPPLKEEFDAFIFTQKPKNKNYHRPPLKIFAPGEYEIKGAQILGVRTESFVNYRIKVDGLRVAVIVEKANPKHEEVFSDLDILVLGENLPGLVLKLEPKIVVIYKTSEALKFLKEIGKEGLAPSSRLVIKKENLPQELEAVWLK